MACKVSGVEEGGFDVLFVEEPPEFLLCVVCHLALRKPVHIIDCGHRFCNTCFQKMKQNSNERGIDLLCPLDREVIDTSKVFPDKGIERYVFELKVKCDNEGKGCEWKGDLRSLEVFITTPDKSHLNLDCDYELVSCVHDGCNIKVERKELEEHMSNCSKRIIVAADNFKLIQILTQRLDVCEKVVSEKHEAELQSLHEAGEEIKRKYDETKEQLNETQKLLDKTKEELNETKEQLNETKEQLNENKEQLKETKEQLNETKEQLKTKEEELKQYQNDVSQKINNLEKKFENQLKNKDEDFKTLQNDVSLRFKKLKFYNADLKEDLSDEMDLIANKSDVENLSKKIGKEVIPVKRGRIV